MLPSLPVWLAVSTLAAATPDIPAVVPHLAPSPRLRRDADLSDWTGAFRVPGFSMHLPVDRGDVPARTVAYLAWGPDALYVAFEAEDPAPGQLHAFPAGRDGLSGQDLVTVELDPTGSGQSAVQFACNPLGQQQDGLVLESGMGESDTSYDCLWESVGVRTKTGYVVKMRIPFTSLRRLPGAWGIRLLRTYPRERAYGMAWPRQNRDIQGNLTQMARIGGAPGGEGHTPFLVIPFVSGQRQASEAAGTLERPETRTRLGMDFRYAGKALTLDGTIRPDFSAVEADVDPLQINSRFKVFYPEKRPFFLEGMDLFSMSLGAFGGPRPFFSRSIADPSWGVKASGQAATFGWSLLGARDAAGGGGLSGDGAFGTDGMATRDWAGAIRVPLDAKGSSLSVLATDRSLANRSGQGGRSGAVQVSQRLGENVRLQVAGVVSLARLPQEGREIRNTRGTATSTSLSYNSRHWDWSLTSTGIGPDLVLASGFAGLTGYRQDMLWGGWSDRQERGWWTEKHIWLNVNRSRWWNGQPMSSETSVEYQMGLAGQIQVELGAVVDGQEHVGVHAEPVRGGSLEVSWSRLAQAKPYAEVRKRHTADLMTGRPATEKSISGGSRGNFGGLSYSLRLNRTELSDRENGAMFVGARQVSGAVDYDFPLNLYVRTQFFVTRYDTERGRSVDRYARVLAGWRPNAFTQAYLGYARRREGRPERVPSFEFLTERGLFAKFAYAVQF